MITEVRCSKLARPMTCAGSLFFTDLPEEEPGDPAKEGTAAGEWLALLLTQPGVRRTETHATNGVMFDNDMKFYTEEIAHEIFNNAAEPHTIRCEQRIDWLTRSGIKIRGSYDASYVGRDGALYVDDLKYGWGIVEPKENWQLLGYAIGEVIRRGQAFQKIVLRIHQPRPHHEDGPIRKWEISYEQLLSYKEAIESRMEAISAGFSDLVTSNHCRYCSAAPYCPAFNVAYFRGVEEIHHFVQDTISDKEVAHQLDLVTRIEELVKIRKDSLKQLAVSRVRQGRVIPGYATTQSFSDRSWKPGVSPETIKMFTSKDILEKSMLSPAKAEKLGVSKELVAQLTERRFLGMTLKKTDIGKTADKVFGDPNNT